MLRTGFLWLFRVVGTWFSFDLATRLMTMADDLTVVAGIGILVVIFVYWIYVLEDLYVKFFKEKNEKS